MIEEKPLVIPVNVLQQVKTIITHAHCPDGVGSAILLHDVLPKAKIKFLTHDQLFDLPAEDGMLFCDIAPPMNRVRDFAAKGVVVLDHHKTARGAVEACGPYTMYGDQPGVSGAVLAYQHVWKPLLRFRYDAPEEEYRARQDVACWFATAVGVRDTFLKGHPSWFVGWDLSAALMFRTAEDWLKEADPFNYLADDFWQTQIELGQMVLANTRDRARRAVKEGFLFTTTKDHSVLIVQGLSLTTTIGEMFGDDFDLIVGFQYRVDPPTREPRFQVSMRSHGKIDVAAIAKAYGGGGHTNAAGFTFHEMPTFAPTLTITNLLHNVGV